jgi:hypothetical protein
MKLFRPVGLYEMTKILDSKCIEFPKRLEDQPIFYPVLEYSYAKTIAKDWNSKDSFSGYVGFITEFEIGDEYIQTKEIHCVGKQEMLEYWIPAEELNEFNKNIIGKIKIVEAFFGIKYKGIPPNRTLSLQQGYILNQLQFLDELYHYNGMDFSGTVSLEYKIINLNLLYWLKTDNNFFILKQIVESLKRNHVLFISDSTLKKYIDKDDNEK